MSLPPFPGEPLRTGFAPVSDADLAALVPDGERVLVAVDGRSGAGKSTFARRVADAVGGALVHTDDVAWHLSFFDWMHELTTGVVEPWRRGEVVRYRPPGWVAKGREGAIEVAPCRVLVVEGVGASRDALGADLRVWVQSSRAETRERGLARDIAVEGRTRAEAEAFWEEWEAREVPFLLGYEPWADADVVVDGMAPTTSLLRR